MLFIKSGVYVCMFKEGGGGYTLPSLTMIDVAICLELPTRAEHPLI